eukprot:Amastigsp_a2616_39.p3 type:complete len:127 gc:universal Amastigsp_a2616_39:418-798(+)
MQSGVKGCFATRDFVGSVLRRFGGLRLPCVCGSARSCSARTRCVHAGSTLVPYSQSLRLLCFAGCLSSCAWPWPATCTCIASAGATLRSIVISGSASVAVSGSIGCGMRCDATCVTLSCATHVPWG